MGHFSSLQLTARFLTALASGRSPRFLFFYASHPVARLASLLYDTSRSPGRIDLFLDPSALSHIAEPGGAGNHPPMLADDVPALLV